jgi:hypothetical protein
MRTIVTEDTTDMLIPLAGVTCRCPGDTRVLPIRMAEAVLKRLNGGWADNTLVMTFRCSQCKCIVHIRAAHLRASA